MVGGETNAEIIEVMRDLRRRRYHVTLGRYLQPVHHLPVRYVGPEEFDEMKRKYGVGFASRLWPLARSSLPCDLGPGMEGEMIV